MPFRAVFDFTWTLRSRIDAKNKGDVSTIKQQIAVGNGGDGSLLELLRRAGWANSLIDSSALTVTTKVVSSAAHIDDSHGIRQLSGKMAER